jgi:hypothetical protein
MAKRKTLPTVSLEAHNRIWLTYRHFPYRVWSAVAELVDNSTQSYFDNRKKLDKQLKKDGEPFAVRIHLGKDIFSIYDNAMGMDLDDLAHAVQLAAPPENTNGRSEFGMGMKTSCCWLGGSWSIVTKKLGNETEYTITIDVEEIAKGDSHDLEVREKAAGQDEHYTRIEVRDLYPRFKSRSLGKTKEYLVQAYRNDVEGGSVELSWDGEKLSPPSVEPLVVEKGGKKTTWKKDIEFDVEGKKVRGWVSVLGDGQRGRSRAGFDLYRRGRVIIGRPFGYRPEKAFGEARNDNLNQRIYGQVHLDSFDVNHLKDDFLWNGLQEKFDDALIDECKDYLKFARDMRVRDNKKDKVGEEVVTASNDEMETELSEEAMEEQLATIDVIEVADRPDPAVLEAKLARLRAQKIEPRQINVGAMRIRIYHPQEMSEEERYFLSESPQRDEVDIFINDNHPFVTEIATDEASYMMYVRMCVYDAIVEHSLLHRGRSVGNPTFPARLKDAILRGVRP